MLNSKLSVPWTRSTPGQPQLLMGDSLVHGKQPLELRGDWGIIQSLKGCGFLSDTCLWFVDEWTKNEYSHT